LHLKRCLRSISIYNWVQGLCIGPDVSHTVDKSDCKTEGNGVGDFEEPPVIIKGFPQVKEILECTDDNNTVLLSFNICLSSDVTFTWETMLIEKNLFVELPSGILPHSSKESFVTLLEYAEDSLKCSHVIVCFKKDRQDRSFLLKVFMFLGFQLLPPGHPLIPSASGDIMYLASTREDDDDEDTD
jgi:ornithine decarboxylase antizyme 1